MSPILARTRLGISAARRSLPSPVVLVPTMGALHEGHRALIRQAVGLSQPNGAVVVSIFVNPLQFAAGEDLDRYPRTLDSDIALCGAEGAAVVFAPSAAHMYPREQAVTVDPGRIGDVLEGAARPGHFAGVLTVVLKLLELTRPDVAVFGEKDAQQLALVRRMTEDFAMRVTIASVATVRDADGLAMSSRNRYLSPAERATALALPRALTAGSAARRGGPEAVLAAARQVLDEAATMSPPLTLGYLALVDPETFEPVAPVATGEAVLAVAATVGTTRLIDNMRLTMGGGPG